jgi:hypothetical protein
MTALKPITLEVPAAESLAPQPGLTPATLAPHPWTAGLTIAATVAVLVLLVVRARRRSAPDACAPTRGERAFRRAARAMRLDRDIVRTLHAMGDAAKIDPVALLLSERALRRARVAALAAGDASGPLQSDRVRRACAAMDVH